MCPSIFSTISRQKAWPVGNHCFCLKSPLLQDTTNPFFSSNLKPCLIFSLLWPQIRMSLVLGANALHISCGCVLGLISPAAWISRHSSINISVRQVVFKASRIFSTRFLTLAHNQSVKRTGLTLVSMLAQRPAAYFVVIHFEQRNLSCSKCLKN